MNVASASTSSGSSTSLSSTSGTQSLIQSEELCLVCNDVSTGYHYGTPSCNGCKTFFRRTVMKKQVFECQYNGNCLIDKSVRCACRHCRFQKCLAVGMSKEAIQQNRDPIGYTKRTRRYPPLKVAGGNGANANRNGERNNSGQSESPQSVFEVTPEQISEDRLMESLMKVESQISIIRCSRIFDQKVANLFDIVLRLSIFFDDDYLKKQSEFLYSPDVLRRANQSDFHYWHERDWVIMIEWAKTIPTYASLSLNDKLALLRHSAITYPSLNQCFYTSDMGPDTIMFPNGAYFDRTLEPDRPAGFQRKKFKILDNLLKPIRRMNIDINEFAAAKAIFFLNPDADELSQEARSRIGDERAAVTNALYRYMVRKRGNDESADRFGKLLLLGTVISTIAVEAREAVVVANFFEQMQFSTLAKQLLFGSKDGGEEEETAVNNNVKIDGAKGECDVQEPIDKPIPVPMGTPTATTSANDNNSSSSTIMDQFAASLFQQRNNSSTVASQSSSITTIDLFPATTSSTSLLGFRSGAMSADDGSLSSVMLPLNNTSSTADISKDSVGESMLATTSKNLSNTGASNPSPAQNFLTSALSGYMPQSMLNSVAIAAAAAAAVAANTAGIIHGTSMDGGDGKM